ncbi:hypothetical protein STTU_6161 [Streptomyces sp. Tu6071]|nr:hypothetical protein STTU_6161 [Streptomyces sp. Tu6071]
MSPGGDEGGRAGAADPAGRRLLGTECHRCRALLGGGSGKPLAGDTEGRVDRARPGGDAERVRDVVEVAEGLRAGVLHGAQGFVTGQQLAQHDRVGNQHNDPFPLFSRRLRLPENGLSRHWPQAVF